MASETLRDGGGEISGINVTPFVDIALVLLIIFMVAAKTLGDPQAIPLDLPHSSPGRTTVSPLQVGVDSTGALSLDAQPVTEAQLLARVRQQQQENRDVRAIVAADPRVSHGRVVRVIDLVRQAGVSRFAIQTQAEGMAGVDRVRP